MERLHNTDAVARKGFLDLHCIRKQLVSTYYIFYQPTPCGLFNGHTHLQQYFPGYAYITTINTYLIVFITTTINTIDSGLDYCISNYRLQYILAQHSGYINSARSSHFINKPFRVVQFVTCTMYMNIYLKTAIIFIRIVFRFCGSSKTGSNFAGSYSGFRQYKTKLCPKVN